MRIIDQYLLPYCGWNKFSKTMDHLLVLKEVNKFDDMLFLGLWMWEWNYHNSQYSSLQMMLRELYFRIFSRKCLDSRLAPATVISVSSGLVSGCKSTLLLEQHFWTSKHYNQSTNKKLDQWKHRNAFCNRNLYRNWTPFCWDQFFTLCVLLFRCFSNSWIRGFDLICFAHQMFQ